MTTIFVCRSESGLGFEHDHMVWLGEQEEAARNLEEDLRIELELNPFEEIPVALEDAFWCEMYYRCDDGG